MASRSNRPTQSTSPIPFLASAHSSDCKAHLLLAASGSVATIKIPQILHALSAHPSLSIRLVLTASAARFLTGQSAEQPTLASLLEIRNVDGIHLDEDEWEPAWTRGAPILHIELRRWADLLVVAPLDANTMAKVVGGMADNLLTSVFRAWDTTGLFDLPPSVAAAINHSSDPNGSHVTSSAEYPPKRIVLAPAMNTAMWRHPVTKKHLAVLEGEWGIPVWDWEEKRWRGKGRGWMEVLRPVEKELACGDVGDGAMRPWEEIVGVIRERLEERVKVKRKMEMESAVEDGKEASGSA